MTNLELSNALVDAYAASITCGVSMSKDGCFLKIGEQATPITTEQCDFALGIIEVLTHGGDADCEGA